MENESGLPGSFFGSALCGGRVSASGAARRSGPGVETRREASTSEDGQFLREFIGQGTVVFRAVDGLPEVGGVEVLVQKLQRGAGELLSGIGGLTAANRGAAERLNPSTRA